MMLLCLISVTLSVTVMTAVKVEPPIEWESKISMHNALFAEDDTGAINVEGYPGIYLPLLGNGYISNAKGVRSSIMYLAGVYNNETTSPSHRASIPSVLDIVITNSKCTGVLVDMEEATYYRRGELLGSSSWYEMRWYAHRSLRSLYVLELEVHVDNNFINATLELTGSNYISDDINFGSPLVFEDFNTVCGSTITPETSDVTTHDVCVTSSVIPGVVVVDQRNSGKTLTFITATRSSLDVVSTTTVAIASQKDFKEAKALVENGDVGNLRAAHVDAWKELWQSGIEIEGRPDVAVAVNASLFAILSSVRDDWAHGLAPGGLTNYYNGHSFWDTETWMFPSLLFLQPSLANSLLQYRYDRLDGARRKAASYDPPFAGTMFPWESASTGVETCPLFAATGLREDHISGDISFAVWQYWITTKDLHWLNDVGYPILTGVADFWVSRSVYETDDNGKSVAHIKNVIPPDEYVDHVDDSVYTNFVASLALRFAVQATAELGLTEDDCLHCSAWSKLSEDIVILFDEKLGVHPEYQSYPGNLVKQADVVLLSYPLGLQMSTEVRKANLDYYSQRTDPGGPAMTWGMHSIGYLELDDFVAAAKFFNMSFQDNMQKPLSIWTETPDGNAGNFITGAGGFLQTMIAGFPGVRLGEGFLLMTPRCPEGSTSVKLRSLTYLGHALTLQYFCTAYDVAPGGAGLVRRTVADPSEGTNNSDAVEVAAFPYPHKVVVEVLRVASGEKRQLRMVGPVNWDKLQKSGGRRMSLDTETAKRLHKASKLLVPGSSMVADDLDMFSASPLSFIIFDASEPPF